MIKKGDFIEIDYTGRLKEDNKVFDTTITAVGKPAGFPGPFAPIIICVGEKQLLETLENALVGKELGKHKIDLPLGFGKKDTSMILMVPAKRYQEQGIQPVPGLQINIDGAIGTIKTVSGGRTLVDFNHPLAGKDVVYEVEVKRVVTDKKEQIASLLKPFSKHEITLQDNKAKVKFEKQAPKEIKQILAEKIKKLTGVETEIE